MKDRHGTIIRENDIIKSIYPIGKEVAEYAVVRRDVTDGELTFEMKHHKTDNVYIEVVGNVNQNPELLEV